MLVLWWVEYSTVAAVAVIAVESCDELLSLFLRHCCKKGSGELTGRAGTTSARSKVYITIRNPFYGCQDPRTRCFG